ncbi:MAG: hypothetical protein ACK46X_09990 [Candidatus Sericytochromatia bacterium]
MLLFTFSSPELAPQLPPGQLPRPAIAPEARRVAPARPEPRRRPAALFSYGGG